MLKKYEDDPLYSPGRSSEETKRLQQQASLFEPSTRKLFETAGIKTGMKVLDVGSGAGDVAMLAAQLVGPTGRVVGVDKNPAILKIARQRAAGLRNVTFLEGDIRDIALESDFDAAVGRFALVYITDQAAALQTIAQHLGPAGILAFQDLDLSLSKSISANENIAPLCRQFFIWALDAYSHAGSSTQMSMQLPEAFRRAGLPAPQLGLDAMAGVGEQWKGYDLFAETLRSLLPIVVQFGITTEKEVDVETYAERLRAEAVSQHKLVVGPMMISAWTRKT
jgi:ubiquinone/menaquinone biosynthesis C-methylase UbiE